MEHSKNWKALQAKLRGQTAPADTQADTATKKAEELWFEVDEKDLQRSQMEGNILVATTPTSLLALFPKRASKNATAPNRYIAMDCEYVGVGAEGKDSALARITLVNWYGEVVLDKHVRPKMAITDYRTAVSGIRPQDLREAIEHDTALLLLQGHVGQETVLVGHGLENDMRVIMYHHPRRMTRDTSKYRPFRTISKGKTPGLKRLVKHFLSLDIQSGEHDSAEDARAAMLLYQSVKPEWENYLFRQEGKTVKAAKRAKKQDRVKSIN